MGGQGFGQGVVEGMQQAQNRSLQMQQLKLQQDLAKFQQKHMETQDQMQQLQMQSFQQKIAQEQQAHEQRQALPWQISALTQPTMGANKFGPEPDIDRHKLTSLLISAQQAGQDPDQLLTLMSLSDPRIAAMRNTLQPKKFGKVGEGEKLIDENTGKVVAEGGAKATVIPPGSTVQRQGQPDFTAPAAPAKPPDFGDRTESAAAVYSQNKYGKPMTFEQLLATDPIQAAKIRQQTMVDEPATIQGGKTAANIVEQDKRVLHPSEANELGVPFGTTQGEARGTMAITAQQRATLASFDSARTIIADIKKYSERVNTAPGGLMGKFKQSQKLWGAWTQSDPDAAMLQSKAGELSNLARSMGEKGALADKDVARTAALVPGPMDSGPIAVQKIADMEDIINKGESSFRKSLGIDARAPANSTKKAPPVKPPVQDPLASIAVPPGLTPAQEDAWRQHYSKQREELKRKMAPKAQAKKPSYEMGTPYVPETGPATLHQGEMVIPKEESEQLRQQGFGMREDGTPKGMGFFGLLRSQDPNARPGTFSSELSYNSTVDGKDVFYPILSPNLSLQDITHIMSGQEPTDAMHQKAIDHALERIRAGKSPFAEQGEQLPLPIR